jgi:hypothetical protein
MRGRFVAAKRADLVSDLGGEESLSTQERHSSTSRCF